MLTILVFSLVEVTAYIVYALWDISDGLSANRQLTEEEMSDISITLTDYFNAQENKPEKWEISYSYFAEAIYDDPVPNQYIVYAACFYEGKKKKYGFSMFK